jgi:hypothetical protein
MIAVETVVTKRFVIGNAFTAGDSGRKINVESWLPFVDAYRTLCECPSPSIKSIFMEINDFCSPERQQPTPAS